MTAHGAGYRVLIVDWLGRGGIAQTSVEWVRVLRAAGHDVQLVSRAGRELDEVPGAQLVYGGKGRTSGLALHARIVVRARSLVRAWRPDVVVIQNSIVPALEVALFREVDRSPAMSVFVAHNSVPHEWRSGMALGLGSLLRRADQVVTHSAFIAAELRSVDRIVELPLPSPSLATSWLPDQDRPAADPVPLLLQFGVLGRGYKRSELIVELAADPPPGWRFGLAGRGALSFARPTNNLEVHDGYLEGADLIRAVCRASATAVPYRTASQSAVVSLTQALGRVPIASAVGGIPEQITDGVDGVLIDGSSGVEGWREVLQSLAPADLAAMGQAALQRTHRNDEAFARIVLEVCSTR